MKAKAYISGPAWAGIKDFLYKTAFDYDVEVEITRKTGLIVKTYYYTVESLNPIDIRRFSKVIELSIDAHNELIPVE